MRQKLCYTLQQPTENIALEPETQLRATQLTICTLSMCVLRLFVALVLCPHTWTYSSILLNCHLPLRLFPHFFTFLFNPLVLFFVAILFPFVFCAFRYCCDFLLFSTGFCFVRRRQFYFHSSVAFFSTFSPICSCSFCNFSAFVYGFQYKVGVMPPASPPLCHIASMYVNNPRALHRAVWIGVEERERESSAALGGESLAQYDYTIVFVGTVFIFLHFYGE